MQGGILRKNRPEGRHDRDRDVSAFSQHGEKFLLADDADAQLLRLFELAARIFARDDEV